MFSDCRKNHGCGQENLEGASSATFGVGTAAKRCELKRCADRVHSRTDNKDEVLEGKFITWTFRLPPKGQLSILLNFFFPLMQLFLIFVVFANTPVTMRFRDKNAGYSTGLSQVCAMSYWWPFGADGRTDVRTFGHMTITSLPNFLGLIGNQICLAMVLRWRAPLQIPSLMIKNGLAYIARILLTCTQTIIFQPKTLYPLVATL